VSDHLDEVASGGGSPSEAPHPEEMRVSVDLRMGNASLRATARATPAGLVAAALLVSAVLWPALWLVVRRSAR
jgi:hypothetical protein